MTDLIITKVKAHRQFLYNRLLNINKAIAFDRCMERIENLLTDGANSTFVLEHPDFISMRNYFYSQKSKTYHEGTYLAIDCYKEIWDTIDSRFNRDHFSEEGIIKL